MLLNSRIFWIRLSTLILIATVHIVALQDDLYFHYLWLDSPMHFVAGIWVALALFWLGMVCKRPVRNVLPLFLAVLFVGVCWEVYEYVVGLSYGPLFIFDTSKDLLLDSVGALVGYVLARKFFVPKP